MQVWTTALSQETDQKDQIKELIDFSKHSDDTSFLLNAFVRLRTTTADIMRRATAALVMVSSKRLVKENTADDIKGGYESAKEMF